MSFIWVDARQIAEDIGTELRQPDFWGLCFVIAVERWANCRESLWNSAIRPVFGAARRWAFHPGAELWLV